MRHRCVMININIVSNSSIYTYIKLLSLIVCLFVCPIITQEPLDRLISNFDWETLETHGNVLSLGLRL